MKKAQLVLRYLYFQQCYAGTRTKRRKRRVWHICGTQISQHQMLADLNEPPEQPGTNKSEPFRLQTTPAGARLVWATILPPRHLLQTSSRLT